MTEDRCCDSGMIYYVSKSRSGYDYRTVNQKEESIKVSLLKEHWTELFWTIQGKKKTKLKLFLCYLIFAGSGPETN